MKTQNSFGQWLQREIDNRLISQAEFARRAGLSRAMICKIMAAKYGKLRGVTIVRIARALDLDRAEVEEHLDPFESIAA